MPQIKEHIQNILCDDTCEASAAEKMTWGRYLRHHRPTLGTRRRPFRRRRCANADPILARLLRGSDAVGRGALRSVGDNAKWM